MLKKITEFEKFPFSCVCVSGILILC